MSEHRRTGMELFLHLGAASPAPKLNVMLKRRQDRIGLLHRLNLFTPPLLAEMSNFLFKSRIP